MEKIYFTIIVATIIFSTTGCSNTEINRSDYYQEGDSAHSGGTPTIREEPPILEDSLSTTNDESNDQPTSYYGDETVNACNQSSGNCYDLDADISDDEVERLYFPKGGWVDIESSDCDNDTCYLEDENGTEWEVERE